MRSYIRTIINIQGVGILQCLIRGRAEQEKLAEGGMNVIKQSWGPRLESVSKTTLGLFKTEEDTSFLLTLPPLELWIDL